MMDKVEMSLDEIIKQSKGFRNTGGRRGRGRGFRRGGISRINSSGGVGPIRNRRGRVSTNTRTPYTRSPGDINSRWQHDMYDGPNKRRGIGGGVISGGPAKIVVSNLDYGVSNSDIQELFTEFGPIRSAMVNYDKSGRSMGSANVVFDRRSDAIKAMKQYNGVPLDGRPMNIELTTSELGMVFRQATRLGGGFNRSRQGPTRGGGRGTGRGGFRRGGRGGSRGGGRGSRNTAPPTAAELDAELDAYVNNIK